MSNIVRGNRKCVMFFVSSHTSYGFYVVKRNKESFLYGFGKNDSYQLGTGDLTNATNPKELRLFRNKMIKSIKLGNTVSVFQTESSIYVCGLNSFGELGLNDNIPRKTAVEMDFFQKKNMEVQCVSCGTSFVFYLTNTKKVYSVGSNEDYQLGISSNSRVSGLTLVKFPKNTKIIAMESGSYHSLFLSDTNKLYGCGRNSYGQCLYPTEFYGSNPIKVPTEIKFFSSIEKNIVKFGCGCVHSLVLTDTGALYTFGCEDWGRLGVDNTVDKKEPIKVEGCYSNFSVGGCHNFALDTKRNIYSFGYGIYGQLLTGKACDEKKVRSINRLLYALAPGVEFDRIIPGRMQTYVVTDKIMGTGWCGYGALMNDSNDDLLKLTVIKEEKVECFVNDDIYLEFRKKMRCEVKFLDLKIIC